MISPAVLKRLSALNVPPEVMSEMLSILAEAMAANEDRLAKQRERKARSRDRHVTTSLSRDSHSDSHSDLPPDKEKSPRPPKEINPPLTHTQRAREDTPEFMEFWNAYPHRVGKPAARLKWPKALEKAGLADILTGLQRYIHDKPADREWLNPATFLHQERWTDQPLFANGHARPNGTGPPPKPPTMSAKLAALCDVPLEETYARNRNPQPTQAPLRAIRDSRR